MGQYITAPTQGMARSAFPCFFQGPMALGAARNAQFLQIGDCSLSSRVI